MTTKQELLEDFNIMREQNLPVAETDGFRELEDMVKKIDERRLSPNQAQVFSDLAKNLNAIIEI